MSHTSTRMITVRTIEAHERGPVLDLLGEWISREFFQRYFDHDPAYRDHLCLVAEEDGKFVSTLQVWPKTIVVDGRELRVGGIGNVFTTDAYRHKGVASDVLRAAIEVMEREGFDISLLFASRLTFYAQFGWNSHRRLLGAVMPPATPLPVPASVRPFDRDRDLAAVMSIYESYSRGRNGIVARDLAYWHGQLEYAGAPGETFLVAEREGKVVAYLRYLDFYGADMAMEHGALPGEREALVDLVAVAAEAARPRGFLLIHLSAEPELAEALIRRGFGINEVEDVFWMWRVIQPESLARKLGISTADLEAPEFLERILPLRGSVYWTSDRF